MAAVFAASNSAILRAGKEAWTVNQDVNIGGFADL